MPAKRTKSRKRSGANSRQLSAVVFFVDRSLGRHTVSQALKAAGVQVEIHDDHFPQGTPDAEWLAEVGKRGWAVLTGDKRIRYNTIAQEAIRRHPIRLFVLVSGNLSGPEMAEAFRKALRHMIDICHNREPPFIARIRKDGKVMLEE